MGDVAGNVWCWQVVVWLERRVHGTETAKARLDKVTWTWVPGSMTAGLRVGSLEDMGSHRSVLSMRAGAAPPAIGIWQQVPGVGRPAGG